MKLVSLLVAFMMVSSAYATQTWECDFEGNVDGVLAAFGIGGEFLAGTGTLSCESTTGKRVEKELAIGMASFVPKGIGLARVRNITIKGVGIGLDAISDFTGEFSGVAGAKAAFLKEGRGASVSFGVNNGNVGFEAELSELDLIGFYAGVSIGAITISEPQTEE